MSNLDLSNELKQLYATDLTSNEIQEAEQNLFGFFELLMEIDMQNKEKGKKE